MGRWTRSTAAPLVRWNRVRLGLSGDLSCTRVRIVSPRSRCAKFQQCTSERGYKLRCCTGYRMDRIHGDRPGGIAPASIEPMSETGLRLVGGAVISFLATAGVSYILELQHPIAFVAAFTTGLGRFHPFGRSSPHIAAPLMTGVQATRRRYGPQFSARPDSINDRSIET